MNIVKFADRKGICDPSQSKADGSLDARQGTAERIPGQELQGS
jgi:hypothetical protein